MVGQEKQLFQDNAGMVTKKSDISIVLPDSGHAPTARHHTPRVKSMESTDLSSQYHVLIGQIQGLGKPA
jgi:hypothetical protein